MRRKLNRFKYEEPSESDLKRYYLRVPSDHVASGIHGLPYLNAKEIFGDSRPLVLDLGCGRGEHTIFHAEAHPESGFVGIDVHEKSLRDACAQAGLRCLRNIWFLSVDLRWGLDLFAPATVDQAYFLFPPPVSVSRKRFENKELINSRVITALARVMKPGATLTIATDVPDAFELWRGTMLDHPEFEIDRPEPIEATTWYQGVWEQHGLPTLIATFRRRSVEPERFLLNRPFVIFDPIRDQPSWHESLMGVLGGVCRLPITRDLEEATKAHTVLVTTTHLDRVVRERLQTVARRLVWISGLYAQPFSAPFEGMVAKRAEEQETLVWADAAIAPSNHARSVVATTYGDDLARKLMVLGHPLDLGRFELPPPSAERDMRLILLGQRQDFDKNFLLEAEICRQLSSEGYRFERASNTSNPELATFSRYASRYLGVPSTGEPDRYHEQCRTAGYVLVTSLAETLCITAIEAVAGGCIPIVPDHSAFREWCHADNRYSPYSIADIRRILADAPVRDHAIDQYRPNMFIRRLRHMVAVLTYRGQTEDPT